MIWEYADISDGGYAYAWTILRQTTVAIAPSGQTPMGGSALYLVEASALEFSGDQESVMADVVDGYAGDTPLPPEWMQVNGQTLVNTGITNEDGSVMGLAAVSGPAGATLNAPLAFTQFYTNHAASFNVKVYQLVSQCVATTPTDRSRTNLGVGEQVNLSFNPAPPTTNITWSTTTGSLAVTNGMTNLFTAPSNATNATVTVTVGNYPINLNYQIFAPTGYARAQIYGTINAYQTDIAGAGMTNIIWIGPTNVSFINVWMEEVGEVATNATGYFANTNTWPDDRLDHGQHGANIWFQLQPGNIWGDIANSGSCDSPWTNGNFTWPIPAAWQVGSANSPKTNYIAGWSQNFIIDASGTVTVQKFGNSVTRTTNSVITTTP